MNYKWNSKIYYLYEQKYASSGGNYLSFNVMKYYIKLERRTKFNENVYKNIIIIFYFIDFYIKLYIGFAFNTFANKQY